jgi:chaperonin GroES
MKAIDSKILVQIKKEERAEEKTGQFIIPSGDSNYDIATVISVGGKIEELKADDVVYIRKGSGTKVKIGDVEYVVISIPDILIVE